MERDGENLGSKRDLDSLLAKFQRRQRVLLIGWGTILFGMFGGIYYLVYYYMTPREELLHMSFIVAEVQNSFALDYSQRDSVSFRVISESGEDYTLKTRHPHSLGIVDGCTCIEERKGKESGTLYPRLVHVKKCDG
jgi:hypothetical protein